MISVIIPTYNRGNTIIRSVNSVLEQTWKDLEIIIIDDASMDNTKELISQIEDKRVRYIALKDNKGPANARNVGVKEARGEWIAFQDSDDCWYRDKLEKQMEYAYRHPEYFMIYCDCMVYQEGQPPIRCPIPPLPEKMEGNIMGTLLCRNVVAAPTMLLKRNCFYEVGGFNVSYGSNEDWDFVLRFSKKYKIGYLQEVLMDVHMLEGGVSSRMAEYYESRCRMLAENKKELLQEGLFDVVAMDILERAKASGIQEPIKQMMMLYLQKE